VQGTQIFQKSRRSLKIVGATRVTWRKCHTEDPQTFGAIEKNWIARAIWRPGFVQPCFSVRILSDIKLLRNPQIMVKNKT
jgi:hypothetical protein